jgi:hypothetical protein
MNQDTHAEMDTCKVSFITCVVKQLRKMTMKGCFARREGVAKLPTPSISTQFDVGAKRRKYQKISKILGIFLEL